ncbi:MAG TPA: histidine phosphatase family protein [Bryobacteraceae bacterium]|jgi:phosphohistidine phosphatase|nr:histidine phosphatase family protein [Bryobacteraceae bacterium]
MAKRGRAGDGKLISVELYLLRHGIAEDESAGQPDSERSLTHEGRKKLADILSAARAAGVAPSLILSSPFRRAVQTAEIAAEILTHSGEILRTQALTPGSTPQAVWEEVRVHRDADSILLTGHEPLFSAATAFLLGAPSLEIDFKKGSMARVDVYRFGPAPRGVLKWLLAPKLAPGAGRK